MENAKQLNHPWLVAVWPGMGHVALSAGYYLMAKLGMHHLAEFTASGLFDIDHVEVKAGHIQPTQRPRSRFFVWRGAEGKRDIVVFIGEAQPPIGKYTFCESLIDFAKDMGVEKVFTFAAMATQMHPEHESRVFAAATCQQGLEEIDRPDVHLLEEGHIGGLNGVLLGAAADKGLPGICLLGEMPHIFAQVPFPKASLSVLNIFTDMADIELDTSELSEQAQATDQKLGEILAKLERSLESHSEGEQEEEYNLEPFDEGLSEADEKNIEELFDEAARNRSKAYELKRELDRLNAFQDYEDRFLDLFKQ
jgi:proteasome assembly chaperone (PAC2) family protein